MIGGTGFVGGNVLRALPGAASFTSRNVADSAGAGFDTVWCAAAPGSMFAANKNPDQDAARLREIASHLRATGAQRVILISTIAVLPAFDGGHDESVASFQQDTPYGANRRMLEAECQDHFGDRCTVLRLPALYGPGLAKNFIFDLLNPMPTMLTPAKMEELTEALGADLSSALAPVYSWDEGLGMHKIDRDALSALPQRAEIEAIAAANEITATGFHNPETTYQYYGLGTLVADAARAVEAGIGVLHLAPPPLKVRDVHLHLTGAPMPDNGARLHTEDMRTRHAGLWGAEGPYICSEDAVKTGLKAFFDAAKGGAA